MVPNPTHQRVTPTVGRLSFAPEGTLFMSNIQRLIETLKSDNPNKQYDACEELRVMVLHQPLPQEAIDALNFATNDLNPEVADAAQRALALHFLMDDEKEKKQEREKIVKIDRKASRTRTLSIGLGALGGFLGLPLILSIFVSIADGLEFLIGPIMYILLRLLVGGVIGSLMYVIRKQRKEPEVLIEAFLAGLIGTAIISFCVLGALMQ